MPNRHIHLGIDYGTSRSKVIFRDFQAPGGEKAYPVLHNETYHISSSVAATDSEFCFGLSAEDPMSSGQQLRWYESVKMRVAGEAKGSMREFFYGPLTELPGGFTAKDIAVLTVWFLISEGAKEVCSFLGAIPGSVGVTMTIGIPMSFYRDPVLRACFLDIARAAMKLYVKRGIVDEPQVKFEDARANLDDAAREIKSADPVPQDEVRFWVRSEAEAAMWWPFQSPAVGPGPYGKVDIGAGTTNASYFRIVDRNGVKERLAFFGAYSHPVGMDSLDVALARWKNLPESESLSLRGQENIVLRNTEAQRFAEKSLAGVYEASRRAWIAAFEKIKGSMAERLAWQDHRLFVIGGGSLVGCVKERVRVQPGWKTVLECLSLEKPADLHRTDGREIARTALPFLAVSYGLSKLALEIPEVDTPDDVPPLPNQSGPLKRLDRDDIYAK